MDTPDLIPEMAMGTSGVGPEVVSTVTESHSESASGVNPYLLHYCLFIIGALIPIIFMVAAIRKCNIRNKSAQAIRGLSNNTNDEESAGGMNVSHQSRPSESRDPYRKIHTWMHWTAIITALVGFVISVVTNTSCVLVAHTHLWPMASYPDYVDERYKPPLTAIGIWSVTNENWYRNTGYCSLNYPSYFVFDPAYKSARAFAILASIFGGLVFIALLVSLCYIPIKCKSKALYITLSFFAALCQGLVLLLVFQSDICQSKEGYDCSLEYTGTLSIFGVAYWFLAGVALIILPAK